LRNAHTAPRLSAIAIIAPPCMAPNVVHSSGRHAIAPRTSAAVAAASSMPIPAANGIIATRSAGGGSGAAVSSVMVRECRPPASSRP
jgi:hypothetical protein